MKATWLAMASLPGCLAPAVTPVADDQPCLEVGYAIARRTEECTQDLDLASRRYKQFGREFKCIPTPPNDPDYVDVAPDLYGCAATISELSCDVLNEFGDDLGAWVDVDPSCAYILTPKNNP